MFARTTRPPSYQRTHTLCPYTTLLQTRHHNYEILRIDRDDPQRGRTPFPQRLVRLQLIAPVLLRTQLGIAGIAVVVVQKGARQEVVEVELFDLSLDFQRQVEDRRRRPGERQRPLGAKEADRKSIRLNSSH